MPTLDLAAAQNQASEQPVGQPLLSASSSIQNMVSDSQRASQVWSPESAPPAR